MKFLTFCSKPPATADDGTADVPAVPEAAAAADPDHGLALPFGEYLTSKWGFKEETSKFIIFAIAGKTPTDVASECTEAIRRYFVSIGVYGKTPFIYPLYGTAEITQAFCRLSAVFGGIYVLRQKIDGFAVAEGGAYGRAIDRCPPASPAPTPG